jgi:hypothetical protein
LLTTGSPSSELFVFGRTEDPREHEDEPYGGDQPDPVKVGEAFRTVFELGDEAEDVRHPPLDLTIDPQPSTSTTVELNPAIEVNAEPRQTIEAHHSNG